MAKHIEYMIDLTEKNRLKARKAIEEIDKVLANIKTVTKPKNQ